MDKDEKGRFVKGHKINEGRPAINAGRKPDWPDKEEFKQGMQALDPKSLRIIDKSMDSSNEMVALKAALEVYSYNHGKPKESMEIEGFVGIAPLTGDRFIELYREMKNEQIDSQTAPEIDSQGAGREIALRGDE